MSIFHGLANGFCLPGSSNQTKSNFHQNKRQLQQSQTNNFNPPGRNRWQQNNANRNKDMMMTKPMSNQWVNPNQQEYQPMRPGSGAPRFNNPMGNHMRNPHNGAIMDHNGFQSRGEILTSKIVSKIIQHK